MGKVAYFLYQPYKWLVFMPILVASTLFFGTFAVLLTMIVSPRTASRLCGDTWARLNSYLTPMLVRVTGRENIDRKQSYVIVSNHQSHYDVFVLYGWLGIDFKWVMKKELRKIPALGAACERIGHIYIDRSHRQAALSSIEEAKARIINGTSVIFFAEGTRSRDGKLGRFKKGAFRMALDLNLPILPLTVDGTYKILPADTRQLRPGRASLTIHEPVPIDGLTSEDIPELMEKVRAIIASALPPA
jgi:1-acyl-sn-glycerol-3-phosphate acyltransferase